MYKLFKSLLIRANIKLFILQLVSIGKAWKMKFIMHCINE